MDRRSTRRHRKRQNQEPRKNHSLVLAEERGRRPPLCEERRRVRVFPQFRGAEPMGQFHLRDHVALVRRWRRSGCAGVLSKDDERKFRSRRQRTLHAAGIVRHGIVPRYLAEWRKHLGHPRRQNKHLWRIATAKDWLSHG